MPVSCLTGHQTANTLLTGKRSIVSQINQLPKHSVKVQRSAVTQIARAAVMDAPAQKASLASVSTRIALLSLTKPTY